MCKEVFAEMFGKRPREREGDIKTTLTDLPKHEIQPPTGDFKQPEWAKEMAKMRSQMQLLMKYKGLDSTMDYDELDMDNKEPLPPKYKFPDIKKYDGTDDPHLHLRQYITFMKPTGLTKAQIVKQFPLSLTGAAVKWYYTLDAYVQ